jgi:excisionase family DNA binding protein
VTGWHSGRVTDVPIPPGLPYGDEFLTVAEAAVLLKVNEQTVRHELAAQRLPGKKVGKEWRLSRTALIAYLSTPGTPRASTSRGADTESED